MIDPITMSPSSAPVSANVPFVVSAVLWAATTAEPKDAVAYDTFVIAGPVAPILIADPTVAVPVIERVPIVDNPTDSVPIVAVPVDMVTLVPNVTGPS